MMAKKKETEAVTPNEFTDRLYAQIEKDYGAGIMAPGSVIAERKKQVVPIGPALDVITSGGIPEGTWLGICGNPKTFKTVLALSICANAQKPEYGNKKIFYLNVEGRISSLHLKGIEGLCLDAPKFNMVSSQKGRILTAQDYLTIGENILKNEPGCVLVIDSVSCLCDEREMNGGVGTETRGGGAKLFSQFVRNTTNVVPVNDCIVICLSHLISNTSGFGAQLVERSARALQYQYDGMLRSQIKTQWKSGESIIGAKVRWLCSCSQLGAPGSTIESYFRYGKGLDALSELIEFGSAIGCIKKGGAWYSLAFLGTEEYKHLLPEGEEIPKAQGAEKLYDILRENPLWIEAIKKEVASMASTFASGGSE